MRRVTGALAAVLFVLLAVACSTTSRSTATTTLAHASPKPTVNTCLAAYNTWKPTGTADLADLTSYINKVGTDLTPVGNDLSANQVPGNDGTALAGALGGLMGVSLRIETKDMPPACVPGLDADYKTITENLVNAGSAYTVYLGDVNQLNPVKAQAALDVADAYTASANAGFKSAQAHLTAFEASLAS